MTAKKFTIITGDFVATGGMDRANYALASYLARSGYPVQLVAHRVAPELASLPNVFVCLIPRPFRSDFLGSWLISRAGRRIGSEPGRNGARMIVNGGGCLAPDINWLHFVHAAYRTNVNRSLIRQLKASIEYPLNIRAERTALRTARVVVCNSNLTRRHAIELCGVEPSRAVTIYLGSDPDRCYPANETEKTTLRTWFGWPADRPIFVFVGALGDRRKGFDTLFAAWDLLCTSQDWDGILVVVGSGSERPEWEAKTASSGLGKTISFLGFRSDVPDLLRAADVLVAPTRYEAYGLGVHEAICCGLPAIVSSQAGVAERYPPELTELLITDANDPIDLANRLRRWRENRCDFSARMRPFSESLRNYSWDDMSKKFLSVVTE